MLSGSRAEMIIGRTREISSHFPSNVQKLVETIRRAVQPTEVTVRICGGCVRDTLLGYPTNDVDLAVDTMTGAAFSRYLEEYLGEDLNIKVISANRELSKHLETARFKWRGLDVDVANLRHDTYTNDSRVPQITDASPAEDAYRRDLTINALFYNINSNTLEDFTSFGIPDLVNGIARSPSCAFDTYTEDPLRVLRNVRHGICRFRFQMERGLVTAASNPEIHRLLDSKVSRERIAKEVEGIFASSNAAEGLAYLVETRLMGVVFSTGDETDVIEALTAGFQLVEQLDANHSRSNGLVVLSVFLYPLYSGLSENFEKVLKRLPGLSRTFRVRVKFLLDAIRRMVEVYRAYGSGAFIEIAGEALDTVQSDWRLALRLAGVVEGQRELANVVLKNIMEANLDGFWSVRPLLNGHDLMDEFSFLRGTGRTRIPNVLRLVRRWSYRNMSATEEDAIHFLHNVRLDVAELA